MGSRNADALATESNDMADNPTSRLPYIEPSIRTIAGLLVTVLGILIFTVRQDRFV